jgi:hypothetical protein
MKSIQILIAIAVCAALSACGGGTGSPGSASALAGLYEGRGGSNRASEFLIVDDGRYYLVYGMTSASAAPVGGVIVGDGSVNGNAFTSSNAHDFNLQSNTLLTGTLSASVTPNVSVATALVRSNGTGATFNGTFNVTSGAQASLSALAGTYGGEFVGSGQVDASVLTVDALGVLAGATSGSCSYFGLALPHGRGAVFDVSLTPGAGCANAGSTLRGQAFLSGKMLFAIAVSSDLGTVALFSGVKP